MLDGSISKPKKSPNLSLASNTKIPFFQTPGANFLMQRGQKFYALTQKTPLVVILCACHDIANVSPCGQVIVQCHHPSSTIPRRPRCSLFWPSKRMYFWQRFGGAPRHLWWTAQNRAKEVATNRLQRGRRCIAELSCSHWKIT